LNAWMRGLQRQAASAAMYSGLRTEARPPRMARLPRSVPESRLNGAKPTRAAICWRLSLPSSGSSAMSVAAVASPTPGTLLSSACLPRQSSSRSISSAICRSRSSRCCSSTRVDNRDLEVLRQQIGGNATLIAAGGLDHHELDGEATQTLDELPDAADGVLDAEAVKIRTDVDVELGFGNVNADEHGLLGCTI